MAAGPSGTRLPFFKKGQDGGYGRSSLVRNSSLGLEEKVQILLP